MNAEIITIGDELLIGQIVNTNQAFIAEELNLLGIAVRRMTSVGDDLDAILTAFARAHDECDIVVITGGLGPTHDDITKKAICRFFNTDLVSDDNVRLRIQDLFRRRNAPWTAAAESQTLVPRTARIFPNPVGTAPGLVLREGEKQFIVMPGVPYEMKEIMRESVVPHLRMLHNRGVILHRTLRTTGIAESMLSSRLGNLEELLGGASLAFLPSPRGVRLRITVVGQDADAAQREVQTVEQRIRERAEKYIYGTGDEDLEEVVGRLLAERNLTLATAESCTGGLIADRITNVSGSSAYFERGVVAYSNRSKVETLGVPEQFINTYGAVSKEVCEAMALGIRRVAGVDIGLSTTGIAGPTGGMPEKPVGLVWIGFSDASTTLSVKFQFGDERTRVKERASQSALELVRRRILNVE